MGRAHDILESSVGNICRMKNINVTVITRYRCDAREARGSRWRFTPPIARRGWFSISGSVFLFVQMRMHMLNL